MANDTHSLGIGYVLWIFGFTGAHRYLYDYWTLNEQISEQNELA